MSVHKELSLGLQEFTHVGSTKIFGVSVGAHLCAPVPCAVAGMVSRL